MFRNDPDGDWERFGALDPYYAVINTEAYRTDRLTDDLVEEVLATGEAAADKLVGFAEECFGSLSRDRALEFGCGVGRLLLPLSRRFSEVTGLDVSESMLGEARANCRRHRVHNVTLLPSDDACSAAGTDYDFVLSYLVLQHIPVRRGERIVRELLARVAPGGVAALHVTVRRSSPAWRHAVHRLRRNFLPLHFLGNLVSGMRWNEPMMQTNLYDPARIRRLVAESGLGPPVSLPVEFADHVGLMFFAQRPRAARDSTGEGGF